MSDQQQEREESIRLRAYYIWLEAGCPEGADQQHWHEAEQQEAPDAQDDVVETASEDSFPASDPPSFGGTVGPG
jgi:hypothetical protein